MHPLLHPARCIVPCIIVHRISQQVTTYLSKVGRSLLLLLPPVIVRCDIVNDFSAAHFSVPELLMCFRVVACLKVYFDGAFVSQRFSAFMVIKLPAGGGRRDDHGFIQESALESVIFTAFKDTLPQCLFFLPCMRFRSCFSGEKPLLGGCLTTAFAKSVKNIVCRWKGLVKEIRLLIAALQAFT